jgi:hypothetical protein
MAQKGISLRKWSISASDYASEQEFRIAIANELASFEHIGERLGIGVIAAPIRTRESGQEWFTAGWVFQTATVPAARERATEVEALEEALEAEPALVEEPDALGVSE